MNTNLNLNLNKDKKLKKSLINGFAGLCGNIASGILYPLELIKLRLQGSNIFIYIYIIILSK
jgi:hypothetical protein